MIKIIILAIFFSQAVCHAESVWQASRDKPIARLSILSENRLTKSENQISCGHLRFRYKEISKILSDISWLATKLGDKSEVGDVHDYISSRLQVDPRLIAGQSAFQIHFKLSESLLNRNPSPVEAIAILGVTNFDLLFPTTNSGSTSDIQESQKDLLVSVEVNAYDICAKKYLDVFLLRGCPKNETETFICGEKPCPASLTYNWQLCSDIETIKVDISALGNKLGLRTREIRRKSP